MNETQVRKFVDAFGLMLGIIAGLFAGIVLIVGFRTGHLSLAVAGSLIFLMLWSLAWRNRPIVAFGIFFGVAAACTLVYVVSIAGFRHMPVWLPALPVALVAVTLFSFGVLAWRWGKNG